jgi:antitoxin MazE
LNRIKEEYAMRKVIEMERKVTKFGNSLGITMTEALKQIGLELGDIVSIDVKEGSEEIVIRKVQKVSLPAGISPDFLETLSQAMHEYDDTLKSLKDR